MTDRQREAYAWLRPRGKATLKAIRAAGFKQSTFDSLVRRGIVLRRAVPNDPRSRPLYYLP